MKEITLTQGRCAIVDDEDFDWLNQFKWRAIKGSSKTWYAIKGDTASGKYDLMHRFILGLGKDISIEVDHKNRNGLDNQRDNLRIGNHSLNQSNRSNNQNSTGYRGVYFRQYVMVNGKRYALSKPYQFKVGRQICRTGYSTALEAAKARDVVAKAKYGEFAQLNFT